VARSQAGSSFGRNIQECSVVDVPEELLFLLITAARFEGVDGGVDMAIDDKDVLFLPQANSRLVESFQQDGLHSLEALGFLVRKLYQIPKLLEQYFREVAICLGRGAGAGRDVQKDIGRHLFVVRRFGHGAFPF
jgi:hypothetical protein